MSWNIVFAPTVAEPILWVSLALVVLLTTYSLWQGLPGALLRSGALVLLILVLANPSILEEERDPIADVAAIVVDRSESQKIAERVAVTDKAVEDLQNRLGRLTGLETRIVEIGSSSSSNNNGGTNLFEALENVLIDVPRERIAGAILVTDGQVHDTPQTAAALGLDAPIHAFITGQPDEADRKLTIIRAPRFGIVGEEIELTVRVDDFGPPDAVRRSLAEITVRTDGEVALRKRVLTGQDEDLALDLDHGGQNVIEIEVAEGPSELTLQNNRAVVLTNGIRDRLRVLLVSGEPHAGERVWRNLLKADPSVDLVHFTILRPPEKQDGTPIGELSLIAFPTRELFSEKIYDFDLIIFDRYRRRGVLPLVYLGNVAKFVEKGGALLTAAGPAFATPFSLYRSPLAAVLPGQPTGDVYEEGFAPEVTNRGMRHPVTANLPGSNALSNEQTDQTADWGRWFRLIDSEEVSGETVMAGPDERPLLILDRFEEGRVAQLMSDHAWLWARGFEGGGPQAEMLRRLAHWLMKEPDLEEEDLRAVVRGETIEITRRSMADTVGAVTVTSPGGAVQTVTPEEQSPGLWTAKARADEIGLYRLNDASLATVAAVGPLNPKEFADVRATEDLIEPVVQESGGGLFWLTGDQNSAFGLTDGGVRVPDIRQTRIGRDTAGRSWIGLRQNNQYLVQAVTQTTLLIAPLALLLILSTLLFGWFREGR